MNTTVPHGEQKSPTDNTGAYKKPKQSFGQSSITSPSPQSERKPGQQTQRKASKQKENASRKRRNQNGIVIVFVQVSSLAFLSICK